MTSILTISVTDLLGAQFFLFFNHFYNKIIADIGIEKISKSVYWLINLN